MTADINARKLRMVMIGGGPGSAIGGVHRRAANLDGQYDLVGGAFSTDETRTRSMGRELFLDPERVTNSWQDLLDRERALPMDRRADVVSIVTPNHLHFEQATAALRLGFHVIMDKPMTMTLDEAYRLRDTVRASGRIFALTHPYAAGVMIKLARDLVAQGTIGTVRRVVVEYPQGWLARRIEADNNRQALWRTDPALAGSGCVGDIGTHAANLSETVTGMRVVSVSADVGTVVEGRRLDDDFSVHARWENGARGSIQASQIAAGEGNGLSIRVYGTDAGLEWRHDRQDFLYVRHQQKPWEKYARGTEYVAAISPAAARVTRTDQYHPEGYIEEFANICLNAAAAIRAVESGRQPTALELDFPNVHDGIRGMAFIQATLQSSRTASAWVEVEGGPGAE
ncbi:MAG: Gfo/Idh/MocA family oxidoreductase [Planctomycetaceae bacterium]|nr:Gfo/Idh/MocA family oxidoreductase [Planctomycetaceae bacterium]